MKKLITIVSLLSLILTTFICKGQNKEHCKTIYKVVDEGPEYPGGIAGLQRYFNKELMPVIGKCYEQDDCMITEMTMILTIGAEGHLLKTTFTDKQTQIPIQCQEHLRERLSKMTGWLPGKIKGKAVCSYYTWTIGCIHWESE